MKYKPNLTDLQALEEKAPEQVRRLRHVATGWGPDDARWDSLLEAFAYHAHDLAEKIRSELRCTVDLTMSPNDAWECARDDAADLIDPEVSNDGV